MNNMLTLDEAVQYAEEYPFGSVQSILACEIRRLRDEVNGLTGSLDRAENALQNLMSYLSVNGCWAEVDADESEKRIRDGIDMLVRPAVERADRAEVLSGGES